MAEGLSNEEISEIMRLARETIKGHLKSLFRKLYFKNRTEAAVLAIREGQISHPFRERIGQSPKEGIDTHSNLRDISATF